MSLFDLITEGFVKRWPTERMSWRFLVSLGLVLVTAFKGSWKSECLSRLNVSNLILHNGGPRKHGLH